MRTGKGKRFDADLGRSAIADTAARGLKGLIRGDPRRIPRERRGIARFVDFQPVPEIVTFSPDEEEVQAADRFLSSGLLEVEIGFADGRVLLSRAARFPDRRFLGFEVRRSNCVQVARTVWRDGMDNTRVSLEDARVGIPELVPERSVVRCFVLFPDPWWKKRHVYRRIVTAGFLDVMAQKLVPGGMLVVKSDVLQYAELVEKIFAAHPRYRSATAAEMADLEGDPPTRREAFCLLKGIEYRTICQTLDPVEAE